MPPQADSWRHGSHWPTHYLYLLHLHLTITLSYSVIILCYHTLFRISHIYIDIIRYLFTILVEDEQAPDSDMLKHISWSLLADHISESLGGLLYLHSVKPNQSYCCWMGIENSQPIIESSSFSNLIFPSFLSFFILKPCVVSPNFIDLICCSSFCTFFYKISDLASTTVRLTCFLFLSLFLSLSKTM